MKSTVVFISSLFLLDSVQAKDWEFGGSIENTLWIAEDVPPAFLEFDDGYLLDPRISLTLDYQPNTNFFFHGKVRADRGFDAGTHPDGDFRLDELILRYRPFGDSSLNIQLGKFPTVVGNWIPTHDYYDDPFLLPPLPYAAINGVNLNDLNEISPQAIETRAGISGATIHNAKQNWASIIWGPAYSNGISVFGSSENWDYAVELKNAFLGSQPSEWDFGRGDFGTPNVSARLGYRPDAEWTFGVSAAYGHYLNERASDSLAAGLSRDDVTQKLLGFDMRWAHYDWLISGEIFYTSYETLHEDFESLSYYIQARYKAAPGLWFAARAGQTVSNEVRVPSGGELSWSPDLLRAELSMGWRITKDFLFKTQYAYTYVSNEVSEPSRNLVAFSFGWKF